MLFFAIVNFRECELFFFIFKTEYKNIIVPLLVTGIGNGICADTSISVGASPL